jgi:hypothetical protein
MVRDEIQDHFDAAAMCLGDQPIEVVHVTEDRIDIDVIGDIVAKVGHRRSEDRRNPDRIDAEVDQIGQPAGDSVQISHSIVIAILKRPRVDLINDSGFPPRHGLLAAINHLNVR